MYAQIYRHVLALGLFLSFSIFAKAQLQAKLALVQNNKWGVFVKPVGINPSSSTVTGSAKLTVVMPDDYEWSNLKSINGLWAVGATVSSCPEAPNRKFVSFGLMDAEPDYPIRYAEGEETLLFTFNGNGACPAIMHMLDCTDPSDPGCPLYSISSDPGEEISVIDYSGGGVIFFNYNGADIYATKAWDCKDNDGDGMLNALEDTNGNGIFDAGDASDLNTPPNVPLADGIKLKLQLIGENTWGVYATPHNVSPGSNTITGSGQVTVVMPIGFNWSGLTSISGLWSANATVIGPYENPGAQYVSIGLISGEPNHPISYSAGEETLLFTFDGEECPEFLRLVDCGTPNQSDPYCPPNSMNSNPGNDLSVIEFGGGIQYYNYVGNYAHEAWNCSDSDGDGFANAFEDTNGNGVYDNEDASNLDDIESIPLEDGLMFKLQLIAEKTWGVYATPHNIFPDSTTLTTEGQVTVVMPSGLTHQFHGSYGGMWSTDTVVVSPSENPEAQYVTFRFMSGQPSYPVYYTAGVETLLFAFEVEECPEFMYLTDCGTDNPSEPFCLNNSANSNPSNMLEVTQIGNSGVSYYSYVGNYAPSAWDCHDDDGDGLSNAFEDTNGNGFYEEGVDESDLNDPCSPYGILAATLDYVDGYASTCAGDVTDTVMLVAQIDGTFPPYAIIINSSLTGDSTIGEYYSGDTIRLSPYMTSTYTLSNVYDSNNCLVDPGQIYGAVAVEVQGPIEIIEDPKDATACLEDGVELSVVAANYGDGNIYYTWQESTDGGLSFHDLTDGLVFEGAYLDRLHIEPIHGLAGNQYRVKIFTNDCDTVFSASAVLFADNNCLPYFTQQPAFDEIQHCAGTDALIVACASSNTGDFHFYWEYSTDDGISWDSLVLDSNPNFLQSSGGELMDNGCDTLRIHDVTGYQSYSFRAIIALAGTGQVFSEQTKLTVEGPIVLISQPYETTACSGDPVCFNVQAINNGERDIQYQWQMSVDGSSWWDILSSSVYSGGNTDLFCIADISGSDSTQYRCRVNVANCDDFIYSEPALLVEEGPISIDQHPEDVYTCSGSSAEFTAAASIFPGNSGEVYYQWQASSDGVSYSNLAEGGVPGYEGVHSNQLIIHDASLVNGWHFRFAVKAESCNWKYSFAGVLNFGGSLSVTEQPSDFANCPDAEALFLGAILNSADPFGLHTLYQWQILLPGGNDWENLTNGDSFNGTNIIGGANSDTLLITPITGLDGAQVRMLGWTNGCDAIMTDAAEISFLNNCVPEITNQPDGPIVQVCQGESLSVQVCGIYSEGDFYFSWETSNDGGLTWEALQVDNDPGLSQSSGGAAMSQGCDVLNIQDVSNLISSRIRAVLHWSGGEIRSEEIEILQLEALSVAAQPEDFFNCDDGTALFFVDIESATDPTGINTIYQWQVLSPGASDWEDVSNSSGGVNIFAGGNTDTLLITPLTGLNGAKVRIKAWSNQCDLVYSNPANINVEGPLAFTQQPQDLVTCGNDQVCFTVEAGNTTGVGNLQYAWEFSNNGNVGTWVPVINSNMGGLTFAGIETNQLCIENPAQGYGFFFRASARTDHCDWEVSQKAQLLTTDLTVAANPIDALVCNGNATLFSASVFTQAGQVNHQWQLSLDGGISWTDIQEGGMTQMGGLYANVHSENLSISLVDGLDGHQFRLFSWKDNCEMITEVATLTIDDDPACLPQAPYVSLGVRLMPNKLNWGVYLKPMHGFEPTGYNVLTGGKVTIGATQGFVYKNLTSQAGGSWYPTTVLYSSTEQPGLSFYTFEVTPNNNSLNLTEDGVLLFTFSRQGDCPDTLFLLNDEVPNGLDPNFITGIDLGGADDKTFYLGGYHQLGTKGCKNPIVVEDSPGEDVNTGLGRAANQQHNHTLPEVIVFENGIKEPLFDYFPNPATEEVRLLLQPNNHDQASIRLLSLQGQTLQTHHLKNDTNHFRLDLSQITPGMYFLLLEKGGVVVQREKLIKK